jgi:DNA-binding PadR family transcriptional regulator
MYITIRDIVKRWFMSKSNAENFPPLLDAEFHILLVLASGEQHGYAIMKTINDHPDISYFLGPATLYRTIRRLLERSLIEEVGDRPDPENDDERRRYYRLSAAGKKVMVSETERLSKLVSIAKDWGLGLPVIA